MKTTQTEPKMTQTKPKKSLKIVFSMFILTFFGFLAACAPVEEEPVFTYELLEAKVVEIRDELVILSYKKSLFSTTKYYDVELQDTEDLKVGDMVFIRIEYMDGILYRVDIVGYY